MELLLRALQLSEKLQDTDLKASTLCNLGSAFMQVSSAGVFYYGLPRAQVQGATAY